MCSYSARGSSPRTWGTRYMFGKVAENFRFIPTYMGNAAFSRSHSRSAAVHPHVHGERVVVRLTRCAGDGSSPRTWGTLERVLPHDHVVRFIPTYMGNASGRTMRRRRQSVHPHVHGERYIGAFWALRIVGSSLRTWGTLSVMLQSPK